MSGSAAFHMPFGGLKPVPPPAATVRAPPSPPSSSSSLLPLGATEGTDSEPASIRRPREVVWSGLFRSGGRTTLSASRSGTLRPMLASLSPEQEAKRYQLHRQVEELDEIIRSKTDAKRAMEKEIEALLSQKRG
ncbi:hypothetical protein VYU27_002689, partial [Nannochloropsis oceanica]